MDIKKLLCVTEYLATHNIRKQDFAKELEITPRYLSMIMRGYPCSAKLAIKIEELTEGKISRFDMKPELKESKNRIKRTRRKRKT